MKEREIVMKDLKLRLLVSSFVLFLAGILFAGGQDLLGKLGGRQRRFHPDRARDDRRPGRNQGPRGHPSHLDDDRGRGLLRPEARPKGLLGRRRGPIRRDPHRRLLRRGPRPQPRPELPAHRLLLRRPGTKRLVLEVAGQEPKSAGMEFSFMGMAMAATFRFADPKNELKFGLQPEEEKKGKEER